MCAYRTGRIGGGFYVQGARVSDSSADSPGRLIVRSRLNQASILDRLRSRQRKGSSPMSQNRKANSNEKPVAVVIGATSKWQADGRNTQLAHGRTLDDGDLLVGARWGVGGAI